VRADDLGVSLVVTVGLILCLEALKPWWRHSLRN
jgi:hypothetical protein